jgi:hypothetical protein
MQFELLLIALFLGPALVGVGVIIGRLSMSNPGYPIDTHVNKPPTDSTTWQTAFMGPKAGIEDKPDPIAETLSKQDDVISHEGVGIVYSPTTEELNRLNEPQKIKEAKQAVEESLSQEIAPEI